MENIRLKTRRLALLGMLLALVAVLSFVEHMLPPLPLLPPNVRLGLSNVVTMYTLFFLGRGPAVTLALLKSLFVLLMRGATAGFLSLCGGMLSICVMVLFTLLLGNRISYLLLSIWGAIAHNLGQLAAAWLILGTAMLIYLPILVAGGVLMGSLTGLTLRTVLPLLHRTVGREYSGREE